MDDSLLDARLAQSSHEKNATRHGSKHSRCDERLGSEKGAVRVQALSAPSMRHAVKAHSSAAAVMRLREAQVEQSAADMQTGLP